MRLVFPQDIYMDEQGTDLPTTGHSPSLHYPILTYRCITIRYTSPSSYVFIRPAMKLMPIARKLLSLLRDMSLDDHPVFFHMFSNNGSVLYYYLTQAMAESSAPKITVKGCIFDSTPAPRRIFSGRFVLLSCILFIYIIIS